ncbi:MAG: SDR family NAD(P)-dependent oxidoreductase, partial [Ignavibacteria bacterium]|nr:SDR family NAD(P)-dependent oxidoreductase [Ignavibacteria bacterium]
MDFNQLNVWITGASSGIGLALAKLFARRGSTVIISSRSKEKLLAAMQEIGSEHRVFLFPCDVSAPEQVDSVYDKMYQTNVKVNVLINNAGTYTHGPFVEFPLEKFDESFATNVRGVFLCTKKVLPNMIENHFGIIVNILSVVVTKTFANASIYSATKSAVLAMSKSLREEVRDKNIKIMNVYPGATLTNIWNAKVAEKFGWRMMKPEEIAQTILCNIEVALNSGVMVEELVLRPQLGDL